MALCLGASCGDNKANTSDTTTESPSQSPSSTEESAPTAITPQVISSEITVENTPVAIPTYMVEEEVFLSLSQIAPLLGIEITEESDSWHLNYENITPIAPNSRNTSVYFHGLEEFQSILDEISDTYGIHQVEFQVALEISKEATLIDYASGYYNGNDFPQDLTHFYPDLTETSGLVQLELEVQEGAVTSVLQNFDTLEFW